MDQTNQDQPQVRSVKVFVLPTGGVVAFPDQFNDVKLTKGGMPDKRDRRYAEFMAWVEAESKADISTYKELEDPAPKAKIGDFSGGIGGKPVTEAQFAGDPSAAQAYANLIWSGQSPDLPTKERMARVKAGLESQGLGMEGVTLDA